MQDQTIVFRAEFRARGYTDRDISDLRASLADIAAVRLRGDYRPEAGGSAELVAVLEFIGSALAKGAIGWVGKETISRAAKAFSEWWKRKAQREQLEPEVQAFRVSFDDVDIEFHAHRYDEDRDGFYLDPEALAAIPAALQIIEDHFNSAVLTEHRVGFIEVPLISYSAGEPEFKSGVNGTPGRYWKVGRGAPFATDLYDSETRTFFELLGETHEATSMPEGVIG